MGGQRGPARTPTAILEARGSEIKRPNEPKPQVVAPQCPKWVSRKARKHWAEVSQMLADLGVMTTMDRVEVGLLVDYILKYLEAKAIVEKDGQIAYSENGNPYMHPAVAAMMGWGKRIEDLCKQNGMTPAARSNVTAAKPQGNDGKSRFFQKRDQRGVA